MPLHQEYAYSPNQGPSSRARTHLVVDRPIVCGRLRRAPGDALCKPRRKFWGLHKSCEQLPVEQLCPRCVELAQRLGYRVGPPVELEPFMADARAAAPQMTDAHWDGAFDEAELDGAIGLFNATSSGLVCIYNGAARALLAVLDEKLAEITIDCRPHILGVFPLARAMRRHLGLSPTSPSVEQGKT